MKKFIIKSVLFAFITATAYLGKPCYMLIHDKYQLIVAGEEIYVSLHKAKQKSKAKKVIIGDSVGKQLFSNHENNDTLNSLACNQAIAVIGQYILLKEYLLTGNRIDTLCMIYTPFSFSNNLNQVYTYHYFLKPFYKNEFLKYFSPTVKKQIDKIPFSFWCRFPNILTTNWAPEFITKDKLDYTFLSPISVEYLNKIKDLSIEYNFKILLLPTPTRISNKRKIEKFNKLEINQTNLANEFVDYFNHLTYLNDSCYIDDVHLITPSLYTKPYKKLLNL